MVRGVAVVATAAIVAFFSCRGAPATRAVGREGGADSRLPEDPVAGRKAEMQWQQHLEAEEHERQLGYDRRRLKDHRAVIALLGKARAGIERARTPAAVARVRARMPPLIEQARRRMAAIDHWGVNSPLLKDYEALIATLQGPYPDAKLAALKGDPAPLDGLRADLDARQKKMAAWLQEAAESKDE